MSKLALKLIREAKEKKATFLDLGNCGLTEIIPEEVFELECLEELNLGEYFYDTHSKQYQRSANNQERNSIEKIPPDIKKLNRLKGLYLPNNNITDLQPL